MVSTCKYIVGLAQAMYADEVSQQNPKSYLGMEGFILLLNNNSAV